MKAKFKNLFDGTSFRSSIELKRSKYGWQLDDYYEVPGVFCSADEIDINKTRTQIKNEKTLCICCKITKLSIKYISKMFAF